MARHFLIYSTICFMSSVLRDGASGTANATYGSENYNYSMDSMDASRNHINSNYFGDKLAEKVDVHKIYGQDSNDDASKSQRNNFIQPVNALKALTIVKRAPNGFTGMRGKKETERAHNALDYNSVDWSPELSAENGELQLNPRILQELASYAWSKSANGRRFKKAPSAFYGVRGKKFADGGQQFNNLQELMQKLQAERMREEMLQDFLDRIAMSTEYMNEIEKRAPAGFMGMRGKRAMPELRKNVGLSIDSDDDGNEMTHQAFKRSPPKQLAFYGTRGKKQPFVDFRNKFVGVRGKKGASNDATTTAVTSDSTALPQNPEQSRELMSEAEQNYGTQSRYLVSMFPWLYDTSYKRAPSGFLGMRGKRAVNDETAIRTPQTNFQSSAMF